MLLTYILKDNPARTLQLCINNILSIFAYHKVKEIVKIYSH